ncbi:MAG TPA: hypothetical protein DCY94_03805 [Firmicutes bacterium]|nr:hypothetical protein [Bacillota bacterium]
MVTYHLCGNGKTIYRLEFSIKPENIDYYISLLENYLTELVFAEEKESKKLVEREKLDKENKDSLDEEDNQIFLTNARVTNASTLEDYLPLLVTIKTKKYHFLRPYTIFMLIRLLWDDLDRIDSPYVVKMASLLDNSDYIDFSQLLAIFLEESGNVCPEKYFDYNSSMCLLRGLKIEITEKYSRCALSNFWQGDEAERELADSIVSKSSSNREAIKRIHFEPLEKL